jgi:hypothetical protein
MIQLSLPYSQLTCRLIEGKAMKFRQDIQINTIKCVLMAGLFLLAMPNIFASTAVPNMLKLGDNINQVKQQLSKKCDELTEQKLPILLSVASENQSLIRCQGFEYLGSRHAVELMFSDNRLDVIQILSMQAESKGLRSLLKQEYGAPSYSSNEVVYYQNLSISLRTKPDNITFVSQRVLREYSRFVNGLR